MKEVIMMTKDGCGACGSFKPFAKEKATALGYSFKIINNPKIEIPFFPFYFMMVDGKVVEKWGGVSERKYQKVLERHQGQIG